MDARVDRRWSAFSTAITIGSGQFDGQFNFFTVFTRLGFMDLMSLWIVVVVEWFRDRLLYPLLAGVSSGEF